MATTEHFYTGNGSTTTFAFTFPYLANTAVKVELDNVLKTENTSGQTDNDYTISNTNIVFNSAPQNGVAIHIYRTTNVDAAQAVYAAGSSIRAADLNNNHTQLLYSAQESAGQLIRQSDLKDSIVNSAKIVDGSIATGDLADSLITTVKINADAVTGAKIADDQINSEHYVDGSIDRVHLAADIVDGTKIADDAIDSEHYVDGSIDTQHIAANSVTSNELAGDAVSTGNIQDNAVNSSKLADAAVTQAKIGNHAIVAAKVANDAIGDAQLADHSTDDAFRAVGTNHIKDNAVTTAKITNDAVTIDKIADAAIVTNSEQASHSVNDTTFFTTSAAEARYFNASTGETIKDGDAFPDNDTTIATTAAINDRIIDLVDDVGGFVPIANETSFPNANPDVNNGTGTLVSIKALSQNLTSSGSGVISISNGTVGNSTVTITGAANSTTYAATFGMIVETTTTLNTYTFHRLVPKATEVTTVAANVSAISTAATNVADINNFADLYQISTSAPTARADSSSLANGDLWFDSSSNKVLMIYDGSSGDGFSAATPNQSDLININIVAGQITYAEDLGLITNAVNTGSGNNSVNTVAGSIANVNTVAGSIANVNTVQGSIANVNTVAGAIANVNTVGSSIADVNRYAAEYVIQGSTPSSPSAGDLWYNTGSNVLNYYSGSAFVGIAPGIQSVAADSSPELSAALDCNDNNLTEVGTVSGNNLQIDFGTLS